MTLFLAGTALILAGGVSTLVTRHAARATGDALARWLVLAGCALAGTDAVGVLASGVSRTVTFPAAVPGGDWIIGIDALSAVFLVVVLFVGVMCWVFGTRDLTREWDAHPAGARRPTWHTQLAFAALLAAIAFVVTAQTVVVFLGAWEVMAISSYVLIVTHDDAADVRRAGLIYLVATHTATLALFAMFATWQTAAADWSFAALAAAAPGLSPRAVGVILLLALVGFGFKAGSVPLHVWLPPAHAAAPSHVSALMSGIVIKTGIYGLLRVVLLLGGAPAWWGWLVLAVGVASGILGVLWALAQHDIKRLLAYHSVENIGIIFMGVGVAVLGAAHGATAVAMIGFSAALLHTVNHALFKSLLFLGAGMVYRATGTRHLEDLGGLARRMPLVWLTFLVGAAAIVGLPPFNGFVSEWLVYQGLFDGGRLGESVRLALLGIPALALIGALALACFAKVAGVAFLGTARTERAAVATAQGGAGPLVLLAAACVALGVVPALGIGLVRDAAGALSGSPGGSVAEAVTSGAGAIALLALLTVGVAALLWALRGALTRRHGERRGVTWACGYGAVTSRMQYTASSFAAPLLSMFGRLSGTRVERSAASLSTEPTDVVLDGMAFPLWNGLRRLALRLRPMQQGRLHLYLLYVLAALLVLLGYLSWGPRP